MCARAHAVTDTCAHAGADVLPDRVPYTFTDTCALAGADAASDRIPDRGADSCTDSCTDAAADTCTNARSYFHASMRRKQPRVSQRWHVCATHWPQF